MVTHDYKCENCGNILIDIEPIEEDNNIYFPKRIDCPDCKTVESCHIIWNNDALHIPTHFKALESGRGINKYRDSLKKSSVTRQGKKRFY